MAESVKSPISGSIGREIFSHEVLGKYKAEYFLDTETDFIFVKDPHWLDEAYGSAIATTDTGILARNIRNISVCEQLITKLDLNNSNFSGIDIGAGYGLFVRGMRDAGFDFYWFDKYAQNLVARGFEAAGNQYRLAVAFEVLEHCTDPLGFLFECRRRFGFEYLIFSATCFDAKNLPDMDWWYWAFETGQHVSFFSEKTLTYIAAALEMKVRHVESDIFILYDRRFDLEKRLGKHKLFAKLGEKVLRIAGLKRNINRRDSLTWSDHLLLRDSIRSKNSRANE